MKKVILCVALLTAVPSVCGAVEVGTFGTTLLRVEERSVPRIASERYVPLTQYLGLDATALADGNLSLHVYGWGRYDFADISAAGKRGDGELSYGYLRYRFPRADAEVKAGRFFVNEGVAREHLDGVFTRADLAHGFTASLFGGAPVRFSNDNRGDYLFGSRVAYGMSGVIEVGVSALFENGAASTRFTSPTNPPLVNINGDRELVGGDLWIPIGSVTDLTGFASYNISTSAISEQDYLLRIRPVNGLTVAGFFRERQFNGYFSGTNLPLLFRPDSLDDSTQYGGSVSYFISEPVEIVADYRHIRRESLGGTDRYGMEARIDASTLSSRFGFGYHRFDAPRVPTPASPFPHYDLSFHQVRGWALYDPEKYLFSVDLIGNFYDDSGNPSLNGKKSDFEAVATAGYRLLSDLTVSCDLSYGENALHREEFRAVGRAEFAFNSKGEVKK